ncbi:hypothetical protein G5V57_26095 [Nordella sp. HKS 07]|uniref:hypothetical protein n=1 Tax=Nordella sp. HKS 07 TaxID=2712222 RepID=UPI0013E1450F|nr:hypothetical protein [Nordella sp. HKS 07]QIG50897.1 hypothetical protein G5V57_26095 [Nordella sp. HKS 07]
MIIGPLLRALAVVIFCAVPAFAQGDDKTERLGVPGPISFEGQDYTLAWTSHPSADYFKQEYLPAGQSSERYTHMFILEALTSGITPKDAAGAQIATLDKRKASDPLVFYDAIVNEASGDVILDFLISATGQDGKLIIEWNGYRYSPHKGEKPGIVLYAISRRAYGDDATVFITALKEWRTKTVNELANFPAPAVTPQP